MFVALIYRIHVSLLDTNPPVWRRLLVPAEMTLARFDLAVQLAMGWQNCHLHEFEGGGQKFGPHDPAEPTALTQMGWVDERKAKVSTLLPGAGAKALYRYDFGDGWQHELEVEEVLPVDPRRAYPVCLEGNGAGPPEDCGGPPAFAAIREALSDPKHPQYWDWKLTYGEYSVRFSLAAANRGLRKKFPAKQKKAPVKKAAPKADFAGSSDPAWLRSRPGQEQPPPYPIQPGTLVALSLNDAERRLLIRYVFPPDEVIDQLKSQVPGPGECLDFHFTLFQLAHMASYMESEANGSRTTKIEERLRSLGGRILWVMEAYEGRIESD